MEYTTVRGVVPVRYAYSSALSYVGRVLTHFRSGTVRVFDVGSFSYCTSIFYYSLLLNSDWYGTRIATQDRDDTRRVQSLFVKILVPYRTFGIRHGADVMCGSVYTAATAITVGSRYSYIAHGIFTCERRVVF